MESSLRSSEWSVWELVYRQAWWRHRGILILNILLLIPLMTSVVNGLDTSLINGLQILPEWQTYFHNPRGKRLGLIISAQFLGNLIALPLAPYASDILGRRAALLCGSLIMCVGVALQAASFSISMFIGARCCIGFGLAFSQNASPLLLLELSYPTQRGRITAMFNSCWYFGSIISAWICLGAFERSRGSNWSWRVPIIVQALFPAIQASTVWLVPESPRWLVSKGRDSEAASVLAKYHTDTGDKKDPLVLFEMAQIRHAIRMEAEINKSTSYLSLFSTPGNRRRMRLILAVAVFSQWSGNGLVSYYIDLVLENAGIKSTVTKSVINGCLQIFNFVIAMIASMLVDGAGRRPLFLISNTGMLAAFCACTVTMALYQMHELVSAAQATIPLIFIFFFFYDLAYTPMLVAYTLELLPFRTRAKGFAVMNMVMMATVAFNQFINPWVLNAIQWKYLVVYCGWLVIELLFVFRYVVETKGRTLEETAALFDGADKPVNLSSMGGSAAALAIRLETVVSIVVDNNSDVTTLEKSRSNDTQKEYYKRMKQYQDTDSTTSSTEAVHTRVY